MKNKKNVLPLTDNEKNGEMNNIKIYKGILK